MRVAVVAEFYPRDYDPVLGIWAHKQALAARDAGVDVEVFVLHRLLPPDGIFTRIRQPRKTTLDGLTVHYLPFVSPPRGRHYAHWGKWAAPGLRAALRRAERPFNLIHAHNAVPAADAALRASPGLPVVVSVHGGDVLWTVENVPRGAEIVAKTFAGARLVLANSAGIETLAQTHGATRTRVVHLGSDLPRKAIPRSPQPLLCTVAHLVERKRHADVIAALVHVPGIRYLVIGDGPERRALEALARELGVAERVEFTGQLAPREALERARTAWLFVMPSTEEAFGVAYIEAMAAGIVAIGASGEPGPAEIAALGGGIELVKPCDPSALATKIVTLLADREQLRALSDDARATVAAHFSWAVCGAQTLAAYRQALR